MFRSHSSSSKGTSSSSARKRSKSRDKRNNHLSSSLPPIVDHDEEATFAEEHKQQGDAAQEALHVQTTNTTDDQALIYSAPTVDTLGTDEGTLLRIYRQQPRLQALDDDDRRDGPISIMNPSQNVVKDEGSNSPDGMKKASPQPTIPNRRRPRPSDRAMADREFQHAGDIMTVTARSVPVAERSAFDKKLPPYQGNKKTSPSWQHWQVLQKLNSVQHVRQLAFSPSVGPAADIFWDEELDEQEDQGTNSPRQRHKRDGRYRSINPVQATMAGLPKTPPLLSNKKHRLPMRSDVGFPNATEQEIQRKQRESQQETEWEEASPRLIVLVTSDDLGTAVQEETEMDKNAEGGLPGMPWAGKDLIMAKERNHRHFSKRQGIPAATSATKKDDKDSLRTNMLAPPLDAIPSKSLGWRPRPFHDRPPGMTYTLVCPLSMDFAIGKMEPLIGSLTLYSMRSGKASEEFYFPAGDWRGKLQLDSIAKSNPDKERGQLLTELWQHRKHKAIFAHTTDVLGVEEKDLHIVLQVYKVAHVDPATAYWAKGSANGFTESPTLPSDKKSWRKKLKSHFQKEQKHNTSSRKGEADESDIEKAHLRSNAVFEAYRTQFTSLLCFGVTPLYPEGTDSTSRSNIWPKGQVQQGMSLYAAPPYSETQEEFLDRLRYVAGYPVTDVAKEIYPTENEESSAFGIEDSSVFSDPVAGLTLPAKKNGIRRFISPRKSSKKVTGKSNQNLNPLLDTPLIPGSVALFSSCLEIDFLQSMLTTPPELTDKVSLRTPRSKFAADNLSDSEGVTLPRILVDVSGDSAIMIDPSKALLKGSAVSDGARRSDLVRLPSVTLAEHLDASEYREILCLPPKPERNYDCDHLQADHRSLLNLLYLYPRRLAYRPKAGGGKDTLVENQKFTVRVRLVQNLSTAADSGVVESSNRILDSFHNPAPWGGANLVSSLFTRIPSSQDTENIFSKQSGDDPRDGIPFRDEYKMKLPDTLDASYFLQFTLFSVDFHDRLDGLSPGNDLGLISQSNSDEECGISLRQVGETTIPLCSSMRDPNSGAKATTVIPNACHRLRIGDFQFQIESRLMSSIHVSDPAIAAALRGFTLVDDTPSRKRNNSDKLEELVLVTSRSVVSRPLSVVSGESRPERVSFSSLFANASGSAIAAHFQSLMLLHLSNLISTTTSQHQVVGERFLRENLSSLTILLRRMKDFFLSNGRSTRTYDLLVKNTIDMFDEGILNGSTSNHQTVEEIEASNVATATMTPASDNEPSNDEPADGGAIRRRKRHSVSSNLDLRISRTFSPSDTANVPFSRKAYGATKTDRMRLEAEIEAESGQFNTLFDDDETIITLATTTRKPETRKTEGRLSAARKALEVQNALTTPTAAPVEGSIPSDSGIAQTPNHIGLDFQRSLSELALGQRMKSAAQVMLAPCVTPGLSPAFLCKTTPRANSSNDMSEKAIEVRTLQIPQLDSSDINDVPIHLIVLSGSDIDDDAARQESKDLYIHTTHGLFRGPWETERLTSAIPWELLKQRSCPVMQCSFVYESILIIWLREWMELVEEMGTPPLDEIFKDEPTQTSGLFSFLSQMDVLLSFVLKSLSLRHTYLAKKTNDMAVRMILDEAHVLVFESFSEMIAMGLMGQGMAELRNIGEDFTLAAAVRNCDIVVQFFIGLLAMLHPAHMELIIRTFLKTLRNCETDEIVSSKHAFFEWNRENLHRAKCSRQLRLRTIEKLAVVNSFVAVNFPPRFTDDLPPPRSKISSWTAQYESEASNSESNRNGQSKLIPDDGLLPRHGWLASILTNEGLSICALSCEAVVAEAMAHIESQDSAPKSDAEKAALKERPTASLKRDDLLMFQSIAIHAVTTVHELLLRRHAMDKRFQKESSRARIAALFLEPIFDKSLAAVRWMARMESTHKVRSIWLLCFIYILQEAPEGLIREAIRAYSNPHDARIHRFIRLLRLSSSTFQSFINQERYCMFPSEIDKAISPWLLQESFNTVCATTILVVEESVGPTSYAPNEQRKMIQGILDLLLHVLTTPQSSVTHLRAVGGAIQALENFGVQMFLEITGLHFQHWIRVVLGLMNSTALSVRSISVDFVVSLLSHLFELSGNIDDVISVFATVLPEVAAREIALCSVNGLIMSPENVAESLWPLRRSFADIEDANPLDDERVDPQLVPILGTFCRASQAIIDGVLIEMRLRNDRRVAGTTLQQQHVKRQMFDADEESLYEAANFFQPETAPVQRARWLMSLKTLHESKEQWVEAAECLIASAMTLAGALPHLKEIWRPSRFPLWYDGRRSLWLATVGEAVGNPQQGNEEVMAFAGSFLEPSWLVSTDEKSSPSSQTVTLDFHCVCKLLASLSKQASSMFCREESVAAHAYLRVESLLKVLMNDLDVSETNVAKSLKGGVVPISQGKKFTREVVSLRKVTASVTSDLTALVEQALQNQNISTRGNPSFPVGRLFYIRLRLSGKKPKRFLESTTLPTFLEWDKDTICRVPKAVVDSVLSWLPISSERLEAAMCTSFLKEIRDALLEDLDSNLLIFQVGSKSGSLGKEGGRNDGNVTTISVGFVEAIDPKRGLQDISVDNGDAVLQQSRRFKYKLESSTERPGFTTVEMTVATAFPSLLSRQRSILTNEYYTLNSPST